MEKLCSVVIPAYNCEKVLEETVQSALGQTYRNLQILIIDDCATDGTAQIAQKIAAADNRVEYHKNPKNVGVAQSRNRGFTLAKGNYVALLDSDDVWLPTKLEKQIQQMQQTKAAVCYCSYSFVDEQSNPIKKPYICPPQTSYQEMLRESVIGLSTAVITKELANSFQMKSDFYCEDYIFWLDILQAGHKAVGLPEVLSQYRLVAGARSSNKKFVAKMRWKILKEYLGLPLPKACYCFGCYCWRAVKKYYF